MKQISKPTIFLSSFVNYGMFFIIFFLVLILPPGLAYNPEVDDPKLEELGKNCKAITSEYKTALTAKKDFVKSEMKRIEDSLVAEDDKEKRKELVERLRDLKNQYDKFKDKLQVINAGEVVKLSNKTNKVVAFLTKQ